MDCGFGACYICVKGVLQKYHYTHGEYQICAGC